METRRILFNGAAISVTPQGPDLVAADGRRIDEDLAVYLRR